ncbi:MAG: LarC family nickel insertion protein [Myxococcota bacterium]
MSPGFRFARLHIEAIGGVAGDMLLAAFIDLGADSLPITRALASLGISGLSLDVSRVELAGEAACSVRSIATTSTPAHHTLREITALIDRVDASAEARARARRVFSVLTEAEARVHGGTPESVHLHEVGQLDSVLDVLGIAIALHALGDPAMSCSALPSGHGTVETQHGRLDCPVPAVCEIATRAGIPLVDVPVVGETITPTGIAVVAEACERFGDAPAGDATGVGIGAGTRRFPDRPNIVRVVGYDRV